MVAWRKNLRMLKSVGFILWGPTMSDAAIRQSPDAKILPTFCTKGRVASEGSYQDFKTRRKFTSHLFLFGHAKTMELPIQQRILWISDIAWWWLTKIHSISVWWPPMYRTKVVVRTLGKKSLGCYDREWISCWQVGFYHLLGSPSFLRLAVTVTCITARHSFTSLTGGQVAAVGSHWDTSYCMSSSVSSLRW